MSPLTQSKDDQSPKTVRTKTRGEESVIIRHNNILIKKDQL